MSQSLLANDSMTVAVSAALCPLVDLSAGQTCRVVGIDGDRALVKRLLGLGLRLGSEVCIVQRRGQDVVVASAGNRIALGGTIARHLRVERVG